MELDLVSYCLSMYGVLSPHTGPWHKYHATWVLGANPPNCGQYICRKMLPLLETNDFMGFLSLSGRMKAFVIVIILLFLLCWAQVKCEKNVINVKFTIRFHLIYVDNWIACWSFLSLNIRIRVIFMEDHIPIRLNRSLPLGR